MASKRHQRRKACSRKVRHGSPEAARTALHKLNQAKGYQGPMNAYQCQFCGGWHIGHRPGGVKR